MNHELRNPLNCINGLIEVCIMDLEDDKIREYKEILSNLNTAKNACNLMKHVINDILDLQRIKDDKLIITIEQVNIGKFIDNLNKIISTRLGERPGVKYIIKNPDNIDVIYTDYNRLLQILLNFLTNAIKFTTKGNIILELKKQGEYVIFKVSDTGRGIAKENFGRIFKPFEQINLYDNLRQGGIGLGLYICKLIIDIMDGEIGFESKLTIGSSFWIKLKCIDLIKSSDVKN